MMHNNKQIIWVSFAVLVGSALLCTASCKKFLGVSPDNRVRPKSAEDYEAIVTGAYPEAFYMFTELMTDNYRYYDYQDYNNANICSWLKPFYLWSDQLTHNFPDAAWYGYYHDIYSANVVLEGIDDASGNAALKKSVKGEALLIRAYAHFMLVNLFAKAYNPATASSDMGVPYVLETEKQNIKAYKRNTVQEVYDLSEKDALEGIQLIDESLIKVPQFHWSKASAHAFLARLYLYEEKWDQSLEQSKMVLTEKSAVRDLITDYTTWFPSGLFNEFADDYCSTRHKNILLMNYTLEWNSFYRSGFYANEFRTTFDPADYRGKIFTYNSNQTPNYNVRKFRSLRPSDGQQYSDVALFTVEGVMFNAAEASIRKADPDMEYAVTLLNKILAHRYLPFTPLSVSDFMSPEDLLHKIIDERRRDFCYEGNRWFDIKRFHIPVSHDIDGRTVTLAPDDPRRAIQIPQKELDANPLMVPNPR